MRNALIVMFVTSALLVSACGAEKLLDPTPVVTPEPTPTPSPTPSPTPTPTPALNILTDAVLPAGVLGQTGYNFGLSAEGGSGGYVWSVSGLPPELGFQLVDGFLRAEMIRRTGRYAFTVTVEDSAGQKVSKELTFISTTHLTELKTSSGGSTGVTVSEILIRPDKGARINRFFEANGSISPDLPLGYFPKYCQAGDIGTWQDPDNWCFLFRAVVRNYNQGSLTFRIVTSLFPSTTGNGGRTIPPGESSFQTPNPGFSSHFHGGERYVIVSTSNGGRLVIDQEWTTIPR